MRRAFLAGCAFFLVSATAFASAKLTIHNIDAANTGLNDPTAVQPVGGNNGTTLGAQRLIALQYAADLWGRLIDSNVEIVIDARMRPLSCNATSAVLASTGPKNIMSNFSNAPIQNVWYPIALANKFAQTDLDPANSDMTATFNSDLGNGTCFGNTGWYYGLDGQHGTSVDIVTTALHEFAHGLGISGSYNSTTGALFQGKPNVFELHTVDNSSGLHWDQMTDAQRLASSTNDQNVAWDGAASRFAASRLLGPTPFLRVSAPAAIAKTYSIVNASFGPSVTVAGLAGTIVAAVDEANADGPTTTDGCTAFTNATAMIGHIALIDRGVCRFVVKAKNAQDAGAIAAIIVDNTEATSPPGLGGNDPSISIPVVSVTKADGDALRAQLASGVFALMAADPQQLAGVDQNGFVKLYAPSTFAGGSSVHHWDTSVHPNLLMEPSISADLTHDVDITIEQLIDIGWTEATTGRRILRRPR